MRVVIRIVIVLGLLGIVLTGRFIYNRWCPLVDGTSVYLSGDSIANATVCRCREDVFLITEDRMGFYVVDINKGIVGSGNLNLFEKTSYGWLSHSWPIREYVELGAVPAKSETPPQLRVEEKLITFNDGDSLISVKFTDSVR